MGIRMREFYWYNILLIKSYFIVDIVGILCSSWVLLLFLFLFEEDCIKVSERENESVSSEEME